MKRDPDDSRANTALGILYCKNGKFDQAEEKLGRALDRITQRHTTPKDGEAYYYLGVTLQARGKNKAAYNVFYKATWYQSWKSPAFYALAELACIKNDLLEGLDFVSNSISANTRNTKALNLKTAILRRLGKPAKAEIQANGILDIDPSNILYKE